MTFRVFINTSTMIDVKFQRCYFYTEFKDFKPIPPLNKDPLLRFYKSCGKWKKVLYKNILIFFIVISFYSVESKIRTSFNFSDDRQVGTGS